MRKNNHLSPVKRNSLTEQVLKSLRQAILNGEIKTGQRIVEEKMAKRMRTSRGPLRDALIQLEHEGLIIRERHCRTIVPILSVEDAEEIWSLRIALENLALRYAIKHAVDKDIARLECYVKKLGLCIREENFSLKKAVDLDLKIHEELVNISRHKRLISCWQSLKSQIWLLMFSRNVFGKARFPKNADVWHSNDRYHSQKRFSPGQ